MLRIGRAHLVVEEHVDDRVHHGAELGQDGGHHADHGSDQLQFAEGGHQRYDAVGHPAQQVAGHHGQHHQQDVLLPALGRQHIDPAHLRTRRESYAAIPGTRFLSPSDELTGCTDPPLPEHPWFTQTAALRQDAARL